jgi:tripartite-type tricarboxylate transporter receptor subunit TctC
MKSGFSLIKVLATAIPLLFAAAQAQAAWPERPITLVVPYTPGGVTDALARVVAAALSERLKEPVVVDNRAGGGANIGAALVARANPDGYTLLMGSAATHAINVSLYKKLSYDPIKDFAPISLVAEVPNVLVVNPSVPVHNVKELIAYAKANPGRLNFGSSGAGGTIHLSGELFKSMAGVQMTHVPYKGSAPAVNDLLGGQTQVMFDSSVVPYVKAGKLRALAVTSAKRSSALPDVPTIAEAGLPGYEATAWFGILAPAGTPEPVIAKLNTEISAVLRDPAVTRWMVGQGFEAAGGTPADFATHIRKETAKWARVVKESGATAE